jgi:hypothetical protein
MKKARYLLIVLFLTALSINDLYCQTDYSYPDLVKRMIDLEYLATPPAIGEHSGTFTSYDRHSVYDSLKGQYKNWEANDDGSGYIRKEGDNIVVFEKDGPGVIWRIWSALAKEGKIKIYLDNAKEPVIDRPFRALFENFDNGIPPANFTSLVSTLSRGRNRFLPIPYNKHCKIVLEKDWGAYYQITYSTLPPGTRLPDFTGVYSREDCFALATADRYLYSRGFVRKIYDGETTDNVVSRIRGNSAALVKKIIGNRALTYFSISLDDNYVSDKEKRVDLLKNCWIEIYWDNEAKPSVQVPVGLFFGAVPDVSPYRTNPIGSVDGHSFYSNWFMPFSRNATIKLVNKGSMDHAIHWSIVHSPLKIPADNLLRFHSERNTGEKFDSIRKQGRPIDWPILIARGTGRFCGLTIHVLNTWDKPKEQPSTWWYGQWDKKTIDWWWGEGDEKFFVDGEKFPSTFGTGSEDYIGYAWSAEPPFALFDSPFAAEPNTPIDGNGNTTVSRFQLADNVPFFKSFEGVLEKYKGDRWGENGQNVCEYESVSYYYLKR